jgi:hypothetical protein
MIYLTKLESPLKMVLRDNASFFFSSFGAAKFDSFFKGPDPPIDYFQTPAPFSFKYSFIYVLHVE